MDEQEVRWEHYPRVANHAAACAFVERLVLKGKRPKTVDAYARAVEEMAMGAMKALREAGLRIPEDVSLAGFDDITMAEHVVPALTTVRVNKDVLGSVAMKRLLSLMSSPDLISVSSILEVELVIQDSVKRLSEQAYENGVAF
jgi:DNA-binding LacI/PurR family transcriptional regulator